MGISTIQSYCGAQIFEALGLKQSFVDKYFTWTPTRIEGIGLEEVFDEMTSAIAWPSRNAVQWHDVLPAGGEYQWRADGERHLFNPQTIHYLQYACAQRTTMTIFKRYSALVDDQRHETDARCAGCWISNLPTSRFRWMKSSRSRPLSNASRRAPCPMARSARKRTRRWPLP